MTRTNEGRIAEIIEERSEYVPWTGCRIWMGSLHRDGYGQIKVRGKMFLLHRLAYELTHGPISTDMKVLHSCDVPGCINVNHLSLGTQRDNVHDMIRKGRKTVLAGEDVGQSKLTAEQVRAIRLDTRSAYVIAEEYGVGPTVIYYVRHRKSWKSVV